MPARALLPTRLSSTGLVARSRAGKRSFGSSSPPCRRRTLRWRCLRMGMYLARRLSTSLSSSRAPFQARRRCRRRGRYRKLLARGRARARTRSFFRQTMRSRSTRTRTWTRTSFSRGPGTDREGAGRRRGGGRAAGMAAGGSAVAVWLISLTNLLEHAPRAGACAHWTSSCFNAHIALWCACHNYL